MHATQNFFFANKICVLQKCTIIAFFLIFFRFFLFIYWLLWNCRLLFWDMENFFSYIQLIESTVLQRKLLNFFQNNFLPWVLARADTVSIYFTREIFFFYFTFARILFPFSSFDTYTLVCLSLYLFTYTRLINFIPYIHLPIQLGRLFLNCFLQITYSQTFRYVWEKLEIILYAKYI